VGSNRSGAIRDQEGPKIPPIDPDVNRLPLAAEGPAPDTVDREGERRRIADAQREIVTNGMVSRSPAFISRAMSCLPSTVASTQHEPCGRISMARCGCAVPGDPVVPTGTSAAREGTEEAADTPAAAPVGSTPAGAVGFLRL